MALVKSQSSDRSLCVVVPAYNEGHTIGHIIERVIEQPCVREVIVVDDGSTDNTSERVTHWADKDARVCLVQHAKNCGKGAAIQTALLKARAPFIVVQDADLEYDPRDLLAMLGAIHEDANAVFGSRFLRHNANISLYSTIGNRIVTAVFNWATDQRITDEACGYKMFRRSAIAALSLREKGFGFCPEVGVKISSLGVRIVEVPVRYVPRDRRDGKKVRWWHGIEAIYCILRYSYLEGLLSSQLRRLFFGRKTLSSEIASLPQDGHG